MKVCIVTYDEYINIPYIKKYESILKAYNIDYDIILWDKRNVENSNANNRHIFRGHVSKYKFIKIFTFLKWRYYCLKVLSKNEYDKLIILTTIPTILLMDKLLLRYKNRYIFDIRDYTYEKYSIYKKVVDTLVDKSFCTFISSPKFKSFLSLSDKLIVNHNITNENNRIKYNVDLDKDKIVLGFVGGVRYYEKNCNIINQLSNKTDITLKYIGKVHPGNDLQKFCLKNNINNVEFYGAYKNEQKPEIYKNIDLINSIYGNDSLEVTTALPNKLYDCILYRRPIVVSKNTYLAEVVEQFYLGLSVDIEKDDIYLLIKEYIQNFDQEKFYRGCEAYLSTIKFEEESSLKKISQFLAREGEYEKYYKFV